MSASWRTGRRPLPWNCHADRATAPLRARPPGSGASSAASSRSSRGPSAPAPAFRGTPFITRCEAKLCRRTCQLILRRPAFLQARHIGHLHSFSLKARPLSAQKTSSPLRCRCVLRGHQGVATERELAIAAALRRPQVPAPVAAPHHEAAGDEVDVVPAQRPELADAEPGAQRQGEHRPPLRVGSVEEPLGFSRRAPGSTPSMATTRSFTRQLR